MADWYVRDSLIKFETPCTISIISATNGGKTTFVERMLQNSGGMFNDDFSKIVYCYGSTWQPIFDDMLKTKPDIIFKVGVPSVGELETFTADQTHTCLVLDDLMCEINSTSGVEKIWTVHSHHLRMTVIFLTHNLFPKSPAARSISLNTKYFVLFKNHRDALQIQHFSRQIYPNQSKFFMKAYQLATENLWGYLLVDLSSFSNDDYRLRTRIFPNEDTVIYQPG
ncbi:MAG: hypothetical protein ABW185_06290 [Sedimenticola sp.]